MEGKRLIEKIKLRNILSFGDKGEEITLEPLNIIIGQNASGKSNLVDVIKLLRSLPQEGKFDEFINESGEITQWIWNGKRSCKYSTLNVIINTPKNKFEYEIEFSEVDKWIICITNEKIKKQDEFEFITRAQIEEGMNLTPETLSYDDPIISKIFDITFGDKDYEISKFKYSLGQIQIYSDLHTNRNAAIRKPQINKPHNSFSPVILDEDGSNLSLVFNYLEHIGNTKDKIIENLKKFYPRAKDYSFEFFRKFPRGSSNEYIQFYIREENLDRTVSAQRLSDGTLRYLCLLAILCHPEPPPLICIEEPETGLHPDILPTIAELMKEASQRTQLIVTTHSDILVSAFSDMPEAVLVCEKDEDGTHFKRLEEDKLKVWLEEYSLGEAWLRGAIGGTRW